MDPQKKIAMLANTADSLPLKRTGRPEVSSIHYCNKSTLVVLLNSILDFSLLGNVEAFNMTINETADITPMVIVKAEIKLGEGILFLQMNETLHTDGLSKVDLSRQ